MEDAARVITDKIPNRLCWEQTVASYAACTSLRLPLQSGAEKKQTHARNYINIEFIKPIK